MCACHLLWWNLLVLTFHIKQDTLWINWVDYNQWTLCNKAVSNESVKVQMWYLWTVCKGWSQAHCLEIQAAFSCYVLQYNFMCCRYVLGINLHESSSVAVLLHGRCLKSERQATMCTLIYTCSYACFIGKLSYNSSSCASSLMEVKCLQSELESAPLAPCRQ